MQNRSFFSPNCLFDCEMKSLKVNDYDDIAHAFDESMGTDFMDLTLDTLTAEIRKTLGASAHITHLDLACGTGNLVCKLSSAFGSDSYGIDLSSKQIEHAKKKARNQGVKAHFFVGDVLKEPFPDDCDVITMTLDSLNHITDQADWLLLFSKVRRALKAASGLFLFDVNTPRRLLKDWSCPEVIVKSDLTYVQCSFPPELIRDGVRRKILMQVFSRSSKEDTFRRSRALIEQVAITNARIVDMINQSGFRLVRNLHLSEHIRREHVFLRNRAFFSARN